MADNSLLRRQHIQDHDSPSNTVHYWGYVDRVVPCVVDQGSCEYLDAVYHGHELGMLYVGIFWASLLGIAFVWFVGRKCFPLRLALPWSDKTGESGEHSGTSKRGIVDRTQRAVSAGFRRLLLPNGLVRLFGYVTQLQVLVLLILIGYLTILTFVGIEYKKWVTPVKNTPGVYNTRTGLGPWSDRIGVMAYALTPLSVLLASRESLLSVLTGLPYQSFMFLHRWIGYIIIIQSTLHTIGWVIVEARLYQPQPKVWDVFAAQLYIIWGFVGLGLLLLMYLLTLSWSIRKFGYEFFRKAHYVLAMIYIGALIGHWKQLQCFLIPSLVLWFVDRAGRGFRTWLIHHKPTYTKNASGCMSAQAHVKLMQDTDHGDVIRLDFVHPQTPWEIGQHFFLCFGEGSIWQSHPMTPLSLPIPNGEGEVRSSYVIRAKSGETKKITEIVRKRIESSPDHTTVTTPVVLTGPYGVNIMDKLEADTNVLCIAGGTGISFVLPVLQKLVMEGGNMTRKISLAWIIRKESDTEWIQDELTFIRRRAVGKNISLHVYVTRESSEQQVDGNSSSEKTSPSETAVSLDSRGKEKKAIAVTTAQNTSAPQLRRPDVARIVHDFLDDVIQGSTTVYASGLVNMIGTIRDAVARRNQGMNVWKGDDRYDVRLECDDRVEW